MDHLIERIALLMEDEGYTVDTHLIEQMLLQHCACGVCQTSSEDGKGPKVGKLDLSQGQWDGGGLRYPEQ